MIYTTRELIKQIREAGDRKYVWQDVQHFFKTDSWENDAKHWAENNMMWVEFEHEEDNGIKKIKHVTFGSSR